VHQKGEEPFDMRQCARDAAITLSGFYDNPEIAASLAVLQCRSKGNELGKISRKALDEQKSARAYAIRAVQDEFYRASMWRCDLGAYETCLRTATDLLVTSLSSPGPDLAVPCAAPGNCGTRYSHIVGWLKETASAANDVLGLQLVREMEAHAGEARKNSPYELENLYPNLLAPSLQAVTWGAESYCDIIMGDYLLYPGSAKMLKVRRSVLSKYSAEIVRETYFSNLTQRGSYSLNNIYK
jgi:hypothetical protein